MKKKIVCLNKGKFNTRKKIDLNEFDKNLSLMEFVIATGEIGEDTYHDWAIEREKSKKLYTAFFSDAFKECRARSRFDMPPRELYQNKDNIIGHAVYSYVIQDRVDTDLNLYSLSTDQYYRFTFMQNPFCYFNRQDFFQAFSKRTEGNDIVALGVFGLNRDKDKKFKLSLLNSFCTAFQHEQLINDGHNIVCQSRNQVITDGYNQGDYYGAYVASKSPVLINSKKIKEKKKLIITPREAFRR